MVRRILAAVLAILLVSESVAADVVVLKDGRQHSGRIVNRDQIRQSPGTVTSVQLETAPADSLRHFPRADVDFVMLEDSTGHRESIALTGMPNGPHATMVPATPPIYEKGHPGLGWMLGGAALLVLGIAVKFGDEKPQSGLEPLASEKTYNWVNYLTMTVGTGMMLAGVGIARRAPSPGEAQSGALLGPAEPAVAVSIHF